MESPHNTFILTNSHSIYPYNRMHSDPDLSSNFFKPTFQKDSFLTKPYPCWTCDCVAFHSRCRKKRWHQIPVESVDGINSNKQRCKICGGVAPPSTAIPIFSDKLLDTVRLTTNNFHNYTVYLERLQNCPVYCKTAASWMPCE